MLRPAAAHSARSTRWLFGGFRGGGADSVSSKEEFISQIPLAPTAEKLRMFK